MKKTKNSIFESAFLVTAMMLFFKLIGFIKQAVIAYYFGATTETDVYFIAWGFVTGIGEAIIKAMSVSLVAVYTTVNIQKGEEKAKELLSAILQIMFPMFLILALAFFGLANVWSSILAPSYSAEQALLLSHYIRVLAPILLFCMLELVFGAVLDSHKSFFIPRLQSLIYSLSVILACVLLSGKFGVSALIIGQYISDIIVISVLIIATKKYVAFTVVRLKDVPELKEIVQTSLPLFIGNSALQINQIVDKSIASGLGSGAVSALSYCHTLEQFVTNIMIVNIGNVLFANFAGMVAEKNFQDVHTTLRKAINILVCVLIPITCVTIIEAEDIVSIVYLRGNFNRDALLLTATALIGYAISFTAVAVRDLSIKSLYAFKDTRKPVISSLISIGINIVFSLILSRYIGILGIALATSVSAVVGMLLNANSLRKHLRDYKYREHFIVALKCVPGAIILVMICLTIQKAVIASAVLRFLLICGVGLPIYFLMIYAMHIEDVTALLSTKRRK